MIRQDAEMPVSRFCQLTGIPRRTCQRKLARHRSGEPVVKGPWPAPAAGAIEPVAAKYAADWPAWGHRKIHALMAADGITASVSAVERAMRRKSWVNKANRHAEQQFLAGAQGPLDGFGPKALKIVFVGGGRSGGASGRICR